MAIGVNAIRANIKLEVVCQRGPALMSAEAKRPTGERRRYIGMSVTRLEDRPLVTGTGTFVGDLVYEPFTQTCHATDHGMVLTRVP